MLVFLTFPEYCLLCHMWLFCVPYMSHVAIQYDLSVTFDWSVCLTGDCSVRLVCHKWLFSFSVCLIYLELLFCHRSYVSVQHAVSVTFYCAVWIVCHMWLSSMPYMTQVTILYALWVTCGCYICYIRHAWLFSVPCLPHVTFSMTNPSHVTV